MFARGVWQLEQFGRFIGFVARSLLVLPRAIVERFAKFSGNLNRLPSRACRSCWERESALGL